MKIRIERLIDESDCDTCGPSYASGARITFEDGHTIELIPSAGCFGGDDWEDEEIYKEIFNYLGHEVEIV